MSQPEKLAEVKIRQGLETEVISQRGKQIIQISADPPEKIKIIK